jgi:hypothetical protein
MSLHTQPNVVELKHGRGSNRSVILVQKEPPRKWLARVRWSPAKKLWLVSKGEPLALGKVVASAHDFEGARELAHKMALL